MNRSILGLAIRKTNEANAVVNSDQFYSKMLQAFEQFVQCDSYPVFSELLTQKKQACSANPSQTKRINTVFNLLDAHVYAKLGDSEQECKSLLAFIQEAFTELTTSQLAKLVESVIYRSLFSLMIYQYKESH